MMVRVRTFSLKKVKIKLFVMREFLLLRITLPGELEKPYKAASGLLTEVLITEESSNSFKVLSANRAVNQSDRECIALISIAV